VSALFFVHLCPPHANRSSSETRDSVSRTSMATRPQATAKRSGTSTRAEQSIKHYLAGGRRPRAESCIVDPRC
jgi:hypothetical protein